MRRQEQVNMVTRVWLEICWEATNGNPFVAWFHAHRLKHFLRFVIKPLGCTAAHCHYVGDRFDHDRPGGQSSLQRRSCFFVFRVFLSHMAWNKKILGYVVQFWSFLLFFTLNMFFSFFGLPRAPHFLRTASTDNLHSVKVHLSDDKQQYLTKTIIRCPSWKSLERQVRWKGFLFG